jgi:hypothetical protein
MATTTNTIYTRLVLRNDVLAKWNSSSLILRKGEPALLIGDDGTCNIYIGDGEKTFAQLQPSTRTPAQITAEIRSLIDSEGVTSVSLTGGTTNGTLKLTVDGTTVDNIAVTGLGSAAFTEASEYATAAQGTKADNAMPKAGGTFTGSVILNADPAADMEPATKQYVDNQIADSIEAAAAMVFKGTIGAGGTVTALPTADVARGDTYKAISAFTLPAGVSHTNAAVEVKVGDLVVSMSAIDETHTTGSWVVVPSGDEDVTTVAISTTNVTVSTSAQTGNVTFGAAAAKQVAESIADADTSVNLPTAAAVASFVEGKGYTTTDENVKSTASSNEKIYLAGSTAAGQETAGLKKNTAVYVSESNQLVSTNGFVGDVTGNADTATALTQGITVSATGGAVGTSTAANGGQTATVAITSLNMDYAANGTKELVLDGGDAGIEPEEP